jgi:broad specificity phosphatase PhoE
LVQVILVRHGETDWNKSHRVQGSGSDTQLNEAGKEQAKKLALRLREEGIQAVYSSPLQRALYTAQTIARHHQLEVEIEPDLREVNVGELEGVEIGLVGKRLDELLIMRNQKEIQGGKEDLWTRVQHVGGESLAELQERAWNATKRIINRQPDGVVVVVVSHYFVILAIICAALNLPISQIGRLRLGVASISTIVFDGQTTRLTLFNDSCHLRE